MADQRFLPEHHIRHGADFDRVYRRRASASDRYLLVFGFPNGLNHARLGLSVSRKVGGAVVRNRWKRLIREAFRLGHPDFPKGLDLVVIPRRGGEEPKLANLLPSLAQLTNRVASKIAKNTP
jgi:ribonuclease P protein component